jgi:hypothetical protein
MPGLTLLNETPTADCAACPHRETTLRDGRCLPGDICLIARSGRQIDRFLRRNPDYAEACLVDAFWERRAIAIRYVPVASVRKLIKDPDEAVRRAVATRLPADELAGLMNDPDREVRITVAARMAPEKLHRMMFDADYMVRLQVAQRVPHGSLPRMAHDADREVRKEVARRLPAFALSRMAADQEAEVRRIAAARMLADDAERMLADDDWLVRLGAVGQARPEALAVLVDDPEPEVRAAVLARLEAIRNQEEST